MLQTAFGGDRYDLKTRAVTTMKLSAVTMSKEGQTSLMKWQGHIECLLTVMGLCTN
jgi:hypothetical protein